MSDVTVFTIEDKFFKGFKVTKFLAKLSEATQVLKFGSLLAFEFEDFMGFAQAYDTNKVDTSKLTTSLEIYSKVIQNRNICCLVENKNIDFVHIPLKNSQILLTSKLNLSN